MRLDVLVLASVVVAVAAQYPSGGGSDQQQVRWSNQLRLFNYVLKQIIK